MAFCEPPREAIKAAGRVKLLLMDCDGVLTDGGLYFTANGEEMKVFNVRDGQGLALWHEAGFESGIISGRGGREIILKRAVELGIRHTRTSSKDKVAELREILAESDVASAEEVAFVGDDLGDLTVMQRVGFPVAVGDAVDEVKAVAAHVTKALGGRGAVREVIELLLAAKTGGA